MIDDRRKKCNTRHPICMTAGFMFGMILGALLHTTGSRLNIVLSVLLATVVFHLTYARNFNISHMIGQFFKKGS
jgi:hypothetical protein